MMEVWGKWVAVRWGLCSWSFWPTLRSAYLWIWWSPTICRIWVPGSAKDSKYLGLLFQNLHALVLVVQQLSHLLHSLAAWSHTYISLKEYSFFYFFFYPIPRVIFDTFDHLDTFEETVGLGPSSVRVFRSMKISFSTSLGTPLARFYMSSLVRTTFSFLSTLSHYQKWYHLVFSSCWLSAWATP